MSTEHYLNDAPDRDFKPARSHGGSGEWTDRRCPKCRSVLLANKLYEWCSFVKCDYGINELVPLEKPAQPAPALKKGFLVKIECHTQEALDAITSPEALRFQLGHMMDSWKIQEEVDYTLEVSRTYENE